MEKNENLDYAQDTLKDLIKTSLDMLEQVSTIVGENNGDPRMALAYVEGVNKLSNVIDKLASIEIKKQDKTKSKDKKDSPNMTNFNGPVMITSTADFLREIESKYDGVQTLEQIKLEK